MVFPQIGRENPRPDAGGDEVIERSCPACDYAIEFGPMDDDQDDPFDCPKCGARLTIGHDIELYDDGDLMLFWWLEEAR